MASVQRRMKALSSLSAKAAEVLKQALEELRIARTEASGLVPDSDCREFDSAVDYVGRTVGREADEAISAERSEGPEDESVSPLIRTLFSRSRYAVCPENMSAFRRSDLDDEDGIAYEFVAKADFVSPGVTTSCREGFVCLLSESLSDSVDAFDKKVGGLFAVRFPTKKEAEELSRGRKEAVECYRKAEPAVRRLVRDNALTGKAVADILGGRGGRSCESENSVGTADAAGMPAASALKRLLIGGSRYRIPVKRLKVVFDRTDRKSQMYVYELRFFQKDYTKTPADTQSYESAVFRLPMKAFDQKKAIARFDKAVSELKFNEFQERK